MSFTRIDGIELRLFADGLVHISTGYSTLHPQSWLRWCGGYLEVARNMPRPEYLTCLRCLTRPRR